LIAATVLAPYFAVTAKRKIKCLKNLEDVDKFGTWNLPYLEAVDKFGTGTCILAPTQPWGPCNLAHVPGP
jgi:hypothetical protein